MAERKSARPTHLWLGATSAADEAVDAPEVFGGGKLWIGEHAADGDILVFDPAEADASADRLSFYSLTHLRPRVFARPVVAQQIREVSDDLRSARARKDYGRRAELREAHDATAAATRASLSERQREQVIRRHERYLAARGVAYQGVQQTPQDRRRSRRVRCHSCSSALDDFAGTLCCACKEVLCSCGACACASRPAKVEEQG